MLDAGRLSQRLAAYGMSQSELARRIGVSQQAISRLLTGEVRGSKHLTRIARELGTSAAFLEGETDDPNANAPPPPPAPRFQHVMLPVAIPSENALARMFEGMLEGAVPLQALPAEVDQQALTDALARELAQLLPSALLQLRGPLIEAAAVPDPAGAAAEAPATADLAAQP